MTHKSQLTARLLFVGILLNPAYAAWGQRPRAVPRDAIAGSVSSQASVIRASGDTNLQNARAFHEFAKGVGELSEALQKKSDLEMKEFRTYWQKKRERLTVDRSILEKRMEDMRLGEVRRRAAIANQWENLYRNPGAWRIAALNGSALNLMLEQLGVHTSLAYSPELTSGGELPHADRFRVPVAMLEAIRVRVPSARGGTASVKLTDQLPIDLTWWPTLLRDDAFKHERAMLTELRESLEEFARTGEELNVDQLETMESRLATLTTAFFKKYPPSSRKGLDTKQYQLIFQAEDFLRQLDSDLMQIALQGSLTAFGIEPFRTERDGTDLASLYHYLLSNSLRFDAPHPTAEKHYAALTNGTKEFCELTGVSPGTDWIEAAQIDLDLSLGDRVPEVKPFRKRD